MTSFELHLIRPACAELGSVALGADQGHEGLHLGGQLSASVVAPVCKDDSSAIGHLGQDVRELPSLFIVGPAPRGDVTDGLAAVRALVGDRVDGTLDQDHGLVAGAILAGPDAFGSLMRAVTSASRFTPPKRHSSSVPRATPRRSSVVDAASSVRFTCSWSRVARARSSGTARRKARYRVASAEPRPRSSQQARRRSRHAFRLTPSRRVTKSTTLPRSAGFVALA